MKQTSEIQALNLVREIRDKQAKELASKSPEEIIEFFNRAGQRAKKVRSKRPVTRTRRLTRR